MSGDYQGGLAPQKLNGQQAHVLLAPGSDVSDLFYMNSVGRIAEVEPMDAPTVDILLRNPLAQRYQSCIQHYIRHLEENGAEVPGNVKFSTAMLAATALLINEDPHTVLDDVLEHPGLLKYYDPKWVRDQIWEQIVTSQRETVH